MDEKNKKRGADFLNTSIGKLANFLTTASVFYLVSRQTDSNEFSLFGYWWSIGIMIGGVLLGGIGSAAVREIAVARTLNLVLTFAFKTLAAIILTIACAIVTVKHTGIISTENLMLGIAVIGFGVSVLFQNVTLSVLRAIQDFQSNCLASLILVLQVPATVWIMVGKSPKVFQLFIAVTVAFGVGTILAITIAWRSIRRFTVGSDRSLYTAADFSANVLSFTAVNFLSYSSININFTLIKIFSTSSEFATIASGTIYFERFILPILNLLASVISLRVLRQEKRWFKEKKILDFICLKFLLVFVVVVICLSSFGYYNFHKIMGSESQKIRLFWIGIASLGYLLFALNSVLFDFLVLGESTQSVLTHVVIFILLGAVIQWSAFASFRVPGWATGWTIFNSIITASLLPRYLRIKNQPLINQTTKKCE